MNLVLPILNNLLCVCRGGAGSPVPGLGNGAAVGSPGYTRSLSRRFVRSFPQTNSTGWRRKIHGDPIVAGKTMDIRNLLRDASLEASLPDPRERRVQPSVAWRSSTACAGFRRES